jgi:hypothetical protein
MIRKTHKKISKKITKTFRKRGPYKTRKAVSLDSSDLPTVDHLIPNIGKQAVLKGPVSEIGTIVRASVCQTTTQKMIPAYKIEFVNNGVKSSRWVDARSVILI